MKNYFHYLVHNQQEIHFMAQCGSSNILDDSNKNISDSFMKKTNAFFQKGIDSKDIKDLEIISLTGVADFLREQNDPRRLIPNRTFEGALVLKKGNKQVLMRDFMIQVKCIGGETGRTENFMEFGNLSLKMPKQRSYQIGKMARN